MNIRLALAKLDVILAKAIKNLKIVSLQLKLEAIERVEINLLTKE